MISYTKAVTMLQRYLKYDSGDTTTNDFVLEMYNESVRAVCAVRPWWFLYYTKNITTQAGVPAYPIPARLRDLNELFVTVGTTVYRPMPVYNDQVWTRVLQSNLGESDGPLYWRVKGNYIELAPTPASTSGTITVRGKQKFRDFTSASADYSTGTITSIANGATAVTGSTVSWNSSMVGKYIRIGTSASTNGGDGYWYEIAAVPTSTTLTLVEPYEGVTISAGSSGYVISDVIPIPEEWQLAPIYRTCALYQAVNDPANPAMSQMWWKLYDGGEEAGLSRVTGGILGRMKEVEGATIQGNYIENSYVDIDVNNPPRDASGFN